jgi:uncharacterized membrane protein
MVLSFDFLATMAWDVAIIGFLLALSAVFLPYDSKLAAINPNAKSLRVGFGVATLVAGFYLFLTGVSISITWPFAIQNGVYNVLFGGIASLGGLVSIAGAAVLILDVNPKPVSYFAAVVGVYAIVDSYAIVHYNLTNAPLLSALGYLSFVAPALLSVPLTHFQNKWWRWLFIIFAFLFAAAWLYQAANFTLAHLNPA